MERGDWPRGQKGRANRAILRLVVPADRNRIAEGVVLGMVLIIVGLGQLTDVSLWPLMLVAIGVGALVFGFGVESRRI